MESRFLWKRLSWPLQAVVWLFAFYIAWNLFPHGYEKLAPTEGIINFFTSLGLPVWLVYVVGVIEVLAPIIMFAPQISYYGAVSVFIVMGFATYYSGAANSVTYISAFLALIVAVLTRPGFLRKKPKITKISV